MNLYNFVGFKHLKIKVFCKNNNKDWLKKVHLGGIEPLFPTPEAHTGFQNRRLVGSSRTKKPKNMRDFEQLSNFKESIYSIKGD